MQLRADRSPAIRSSVRGSAALFQKALLAIASWDARKRASRPRKNSKTCHSEPRSVFERVRNLLFPWLSCEQQISHPQTTRVRDDKRAFFRSLLEAPPGVQVDCSSIPQPAKTILKLVFVLRDPPGRKDLRNAKLLCPRSPLGLKLSSYVPDGDLQELTGHTLLRVR